MTILWMPEGHHRIPFNQSPKNPRTRESSRMPVAASSRSAAGQRSLRGRLVLDPTPGRRLPTVTVPRRPSTVSSRASPSARPFQRPAHSIALGDADLVVVETSARSMTSRPPTWGPNDGAGRDHAHHDPPCARAVRQSPAAAQDGLAPRPINDLTTAPVRGSRNAGHTTYNASDVTWPWQPDGEPPAPRGRPVAPLIQPAGPRRKDIPTAIRMAEVLEAPTGCSAGEEGYDREFNGSSTTPAAGSSGWRAHAAPTPTPTSAVPQQLGRVRQPAVERLQRNHGRRPRGAAEARQWGSACSRRQTRAARRYLPGRTMSGGRNKAIARAASATRVCASCPLIGGMWRTAKLIRPNESVPRDLDGEAVGVNACPRVQDRRPNRCSSAGADPAPRTSGSGRLRPLRPGHRAVRGGVHRELTRSS